MEVVLVGDGWIGCLEMTLWLLAPALLSLKTDALLPAAPLPFEYWHVTLDLLIADSGERPCY
jgi:hypothetical protein